MCVYVCVCLCMRAVTHRVNGEPPCIFVSNATFDISKSASI